jgi:non-specific serine/threonine protein kinase
VAWSHDLLGKQEVTLFRRLSAFSGGWDLAAVEGVCGSPTEVGEALGGVSSLVDHSLVVLDRNHASARYRMLDVVREYAAQELHKAGETEEIGRRHALHYLALSEEAGPNLMRAGHEEWFSRLDVERGNVRRAMAWAIERGETVLALRYTVALWRYWRQLGEFVEGRRWSEAAVAMPGEVASSLRAKALGAAAALAWPQGDYDRMAALSAEAIDLARQSEDPMDLRDALTVKGMVAMGQGRYAEAVERFQETVAICRPLGLSWQLATSHLNLGTALVLNGSPEEAEATLEEGLEMYRQLGDDIFAARMTNGIAYAALARKDIARADSLARIALAAFAEQAERQGLAQGLETLAAVAAARGDAERAAMLGGAAAAVRETIAARAAQFEVAVSGPFMERVQKAADKEVWRRAWEAGLAMGPDAAVAYALG